MVQPRERESKIGMSPSKKIFCLLCIPLTVIARIWRRVRADVPVAKQNRTVKTRTPVSFREKDRRAKFYNFLASNRCRPMHPIEQKSKLLALPAELRSRIWSYVYGGTIHIARRERSMRCAMCLGPELVQISEEKDIKQDEKGKIDLSSVKDVVQCTCLRIGVEARMHARRPQDVIRTERETLLNHEAPLSGLYRACRQTYNEASDLVYTESTFALPTQLSLKHFADTIPAKRLTQIQSLHLYIHLDSWTSRSRCGWHGLSTDEDAQKDLLQACEVLKSMRGLREMVVILRFGGGGWRHSNYEDFFRECSQFRMSVERLGGAIKRKSIEGTLCLVIEARYCRGDYMAWEEVRNGTGDLHDVMGLGWTLGRWVPARKDDR